VGTTLFPSRVERGDIKIILPAPARTTRDGKPNPHPAGITCLADDITGRNEEKIHTPAAVENDRLEG